MSQTDGRKTDLEARESKEGLVEERKCSKVEHRNPSSNYTLCPPVHKKGFLFFAFQYSMQF